MYFKHDSKTMKVWVWFDNWDCNNNAELLWRLQEKSNGQTLSKKHLFGTGRLLDSYWVNFNSRSED